MISVVTNRGTSCYGNTKRRTPKGIMEGFTELSDFGGESQDRKQRVASGYRK